MHYRGIVGFECENPMDIYLTLETQSPCRVSLGTIEIINKIIGRCILRGIDQWWSQCHSLKCIDCCYHSPFTKSFVMLLDFMTIKYFHKGFLAQGRCKGKQVIPHEWRNPHKSTTILAFYQFYLLLGKMITLFFFS